MELPDVIQMGIENFEWAEHDLIQEALPFFWISTIQFFPYITRNIVGC